MHQTTHSPFLLGLLGVLAVAFIPLSLLAQDQRLYGSEELPSADELIDALNPNSPTRGFRVVPKGEQAATEPARAAVSMQINFEFNSYDLSPNAKRQLNALGQALQSSELDQDSFLIEGHTDSVGTEQYNMRLSENRADVVKRYLVEYGGVDGQRLKSEGQGEKVLLNEQDPTSAINRRVQIVNMRPVQ